MNFQTTIIKNLIISTFPIIVFVIADALIKNTFYSIIIAVLISIVEFNIVFFKYKKFDLFIIFDIILISLLGGISIIIKDPIFFKLKPAIIEVIIFLYFIPICFSSKFLDGYISRYFRDMDIPIDKLKMLQKNLFFFLPVILIHIALIVITAYYFSTEIWGFVSSFLLYIIVGLVFLSIFLYKLIYRKSFEKKYQNEEWFDIVTEEGKVTGRSPRSICHNGSKLLHPVVHIHIFNSSNKLLLQKRSMAKDIQPGLWDTSVGGHISSGEKLMDAIIREVKEEAGIDIITQKLLPVTKYVFESDIEKELVFTFLYVTNDKIIHKEDEIDEVKFYSKKDIEKLIKEELVTQNFIIEFDILKKSDIVQKIVKFQ